MPRHVLGGRIRLSTVLVALLFGITLATYLLVRPVPASIGRDAPAASPSPSTNSRPSKSPTVTSPTPTTATPHPSPTSTASPSASDTSISTPASPTQ